MNTFSEANKPCRIMVVTRGVFMAVLLFGYYVVTCQAAVNVTVVNQGNCTLTLQLKGRNSTPTFTVNIDPDNGATVAAGATKTFTWAAINQGSGGPPVYYYAVVQNAAPTIVYGNYTSGFANGVTLYLSGGGNV